LGLVFFVCFGKESVLMEKRSPLVVIAGCAFIFLLLAIPGCRSECETSGCHLSRGAELFSKGHYTQAEAEYLAAVSDNPSSAKAWTGLAETRLKLGKVRDAVEAYQMVLKADPANVKAKITLARFDLLAGRHDRAEKRLREILEDHPENLDALFLFADLCEREGRLIQAEQCYRRILSSRPGDAKALVHLANVYMRRGNSEKALECLNRAVSGAPSGIEPYLALARFYMARKDYDAVEKSLAALAETHPENPDVHIILGNFYVSRGKMKKAGHSFLLAVKADPGHVRSYIAAGDFYQLSGEPEKALKMYKAALEHEPQNIRARLVLANFYLGNGEYEDAKREIETVLKVNPGFSQARLMKVRLLIALGEYDRAISLCDTYLAENPVSGDLAYLKGVAFAGKNDLADAEKAFRRAIRFSPGNISARLQLAKLYLNNGQQEKAQRVNQDLLRFIQEHTNTVVNLGGTRLSREPGIKSIESFASLVSASYFYSFGEPRTERVKRLMEKYDQTIEGFEQALRQDPSRTGVFENIVLLYVAKKDYEKALERCDKRIRELAVMPGLSQALRRRHEAAAYDLKGGVYMLMGQLANARLSFRKAVSTDPDFLKPYYALARLCIIEKDIDGAISQYRAILAKNPNLAGPHMLLGVLYKMKGDLKQAEAHYKTALSIDSGLAQAANNLAYLLSGIPDRLDEALQFALKAMDIAKDDPYIRDTLGWIYYRMGRCNDARKELQQAAAAIPDSATVNYHLGMVYKCNGELYKASAFLDRALSISDDFYGAKEAKLILKKLMQ